ncbi:MAG: CopG family transcriptional regulator, partial [Lacisediminimonas sp.]|nr:CopG family transcriptional regulator [Lacisediminimonas sp.]
MNRKLLLIALLGTAALAQAANENITVYKDPDCGCCTAWIDHLRENGYKVRAVNTSDMDAIKK